jgi:hypothetical protein
MCLLAAMINILFIENFKHVIKIIFSAFDYVNNGIVRKRGRPEYVTQFGKDAVYAEVANRTLTLNSIECYSDEFRCLMHEQAKIQKNDPFVKPCSGQQLRKLKKQMGVITVAADKKTRKRREAYMNIRNNISFVAMLDYIFKRVRPGQIVSTDDTSVYIHEDGTVKVIATKESKKFLRESNTGVSASGTQPQKRVLTFNCSITADCQLICTVIKFSDRNFEDFKEEPAIYKLKPGLFVCLFHPSMDDSVLNTHVYRYCIIRTARAMREANIELDSTGLTREVPTELSQSEPQQPQLQSSSSSSSSHMQPIDNTVPFKDCIDSSKALSTAEAADKYKFICLLNDGAYGQINALTGPLYEYSVTAGWNLIFAKYAAGCSMSQQVNDVGMMHLIIKQLFRSKRYTYEPLPEPDGVKWIQLRDLLRSKLSLPSFLTVWHALKHSEGILNKAFTISTLRSAFRKDGFMPFDHNVIMTKCPHFNTLTPTDKQFVMSCIPRFCKVFEEKGTIEESDYDEIFAEQPSVDNCPPKAGQPLNNLTLPRQRCVVHTHMLFRKNLVRRGLAEQVNAEFEEGCEEEEEELGEEVESLALPAPVEDQGKEDDTMAARKRQKRVKLYRCANFACYETNSDAPAWNSCAKCGGDKKCKLFFCLAPNCTEAMTTHIKGCARQNKTSKK